MDTELEVDIRRGRATVRLRENPTTGYRWELAELPAGVRLTADRYEPDPAGPGVVGGGGEHVFALRAPNREARIVARLCRPWEDGAIETRTVRLRPPPPRPRSRQRG